MRSSRKNTLQIKTRCKLTDYSIKLPQFRFLIAILVECLSAVGAKADGALALFVTHVYYSQPVWQFFKTDEIFSQLKKGIYKAVGEFHLFELLLSLMLQVKEFV